MRLDFGKMVEIRGELTAAVLLIPVSLALQDFAHAMFTCPDFLITPHAEPFWLGAFFLLSLICVTLLSICMLHLAEYSTLERGLLFLCLLSYVVLVAMSGSIADVKLDGSGVRFWLIISIIPVLIVSIFLIDWEDSLSLDWLISADVLGLLCVFLLITLV